MIPDNEFSDICTGDMCDMDEAYHNLLKRKQTIKPRGTEVNNDRIEIKWRGRVIYLSLHEVQQVLDGINSDCTNNELCSMLELFIANADLETIRATQEGLNRQEQHDIMQDYKSE